jgi:hypothetical protein
MWSEEEWNYKLAKKTGISSLINHLQLVLIYVEEAVDSGHDLSRVGLIKALSEGSTSN